MPKPSASKPANGELEAAQTLYRDSLNAQKDQRNQIHDDIKFSDPSEPDQWDPKTKAQRLADPGGMRPCLVHDLTGQYVANVAGQVEKQPPAMHAVPVGGGADKQAADQIDGRFRHIEYASRAQQHYARTLTNAARLGVGYIIIRPEIVDPKLNIQEPRVSSAPDPLKVVFDPWSVELDGSDANFAFLLTPMSKAEFERRWPGKEAKDFGSTDQPEPHDERDEVTVAEMWKKVDTRVKMFDYIDPSTGEPTSGDEDEYIEACVQAGMAVGKDAVRIPARQHVVTTRTVKWCRMSGADILDEPKDEDGNVASFPADDIGVVPVYGYIGFTDGRMKYCGIPRRARAAQQAYNYHISEQMAYIATAPKSPWIVSKRAIKGLEHIWDRASVQTRAYLPYNDSDDEGQIPVPQRTNVASNIINHQAGAEQAKQDLQAAIGMYQANIGAQSNVVSGVAYDAQKQQGEASTAHFPSHLAASLTQVGKIIIDMDKRLADTPREMPIIGVDGSAGSVRVDPDQRQPFKRTADGVSINPNVGKYSARVTIGASYVTQRKETNAAFSEVMRGNPALGPVVAPFWAQTLDFPGSDKFAQALAAMAPPPVKAILQPEGQADAPDPAALAEENAKLKAALQEAIQHAHDAQEDADKAIHDQAAKDMDSRTKSRELDISAYNAETNRLKVTGANEAQIQAVVRDLIEQMLQSPDPLPGDPVQVASPQLPPDEPMPAAQPQPDTPPEMGAPQPSQQPAPLAPSQ